MYCLIQLADILLRIFTSIFISDSSPLPTDVKDLHSENYKMQIKKKKKKNRDETNKKIYCIRELE